jgi:DNA-binding MarR family transcriptional regulator
LHFATIDKGNKIMSSPQLSAAIVMDNVPLLMRILRTKFREMHTGRLSMVQFRTLTFLNTNQDASLSETATAIGLSLPSMSKLVEVLVNMNLIHREMHGGDRRRICLSITERGKSELDEAYQHTQTYFAEKFASLNEDERDQIEAAMNIMKKLFLLEPKLNNPETIKKDAIPA